jgi:hypothetical protein
MELEKVWKEAFKKKTFLLLFFDFAFLTFGFSAKSKNKTLKLQIYQNPLHKITISGRISITRANNIAR